MKAHEPTLLCMELFGNVTVNKKLLSADSYRAEDYLLERISHYTDRNYPIPDGKLIVMRFPDRGKIPEYDALDGYQFIETCKHIWPALHDTLGVRVPFEGKLQLAAYCLANGKNATYGAMQKEFFTEGFAEFHSRQSTRIGMFEDSFQENIPQHKRPDDWSFVLGMTGRMFTEEEQKDIIALGCILSNGMERYILTPASFPSLNHISITPTFVRAVLDGRDMPAEDFRSESMKIKVRASEILSRLYPEVAPFIKDLSGFTTGTPGNEVYGLIGGPGMPNFVKDNFPSVTDNNPQLGFMDFMRFYCESGILKDTPNLSQYRFVRLRGEGINYASSEMPLNGDYWQHWNLFLQKAKNRGIKPMNDVSYVDASYCLSNGRSPLHPANIHRNLVMEPSYMKYVNEFINREAEQKVPRARIRPDAKLTDAPLNDQRNKPTMQKKRRI